MKKLLTLGAVMAIASACTSTENTPGAPAEDSQTTSGSTSDDAQSDAVADSTSPPNDSGKTEPEVIVPPTDTDAPPTPDSVEPPAPVDPMVCTGNFQSSLQAFGGSCCYTTPGHPENPDCVWYADDYGYGACLDVQCDTGVCREPYCSKACDIVEDNVINATNQPGADGITDPDALNQCEGAVDGPAGTVFRCVNLAQPDNDVNGQCQPGTTFASCEANSDCPGGEVCSVMYILGQYQKRCRIPVKDALPGAAECNSNPNNGAMTECAGPYCYSYGCVDACADNSDCATDTCVDGACSKDPNTACTTDEECSAWECVLEKPFSSNAFEALMCQPKACDSASECPDPEWFCRPFWNGAATVEEVAFAPACRRAEPNTADYGEACSASGDPNPPCVYGSACIDGYCAGPCSQDEHCEDGIECLVGNEWNIDVDDDDTIDTYLSVDMCTPWPHAGDALTDCTSDADCPAGEHCQQRVRGEGVAPDRVWHVEYKCRADMEGQVGFGEACGATNGAPCKSDLCLVPGSNNDNPAFCSTYCSSASDCPESMQYDGLNWKTICLSYRVHRNNNADATDDVYVPYCRHTSSVGTLVSCEETRQCSKSKEYCRAMAIAGNPDEPVTVEHLCADASEGLTAFPTKGVGEACESWTECRGRRCLPDGEGGRYCSELCATDADCQSPDAIDSLKCTDEVLIARPNPENNGVTTRCIRQKTCMQCESDSDCGGTYQCVNFGGLGFTVDLRCGSPCETDEDCPAADMSCVEDVDSVTGALSGKKVCGPSFCE
jgi:hypothetical protein